MGIGEQATTVNRKALLLFVASSIIWGRSFLFIRVAVTHLPPSALVFGRRVLGAAILVPLAARRRAFRGVRQVIVPHRHRDPLPDMAVPTFLTAWGEQHISSSAAGILTATDPLYGRGCQFDRSADLASAVSLFSAVPRRSGLAGSFRACVRRRLP